MRARGRRYAAAALALTTVLGLTAAACSGSSSVHSVTTTTSLPASTLPGRHTTGLPPPQLSWHPCGRFRCAELVVPVSYSDQAEGTIQLAVIELPAGHDAASAPDLVMNPGGPGESGVQFLQEAFSQFPSALRFRFNLVSFDPRGVGESAPVVCVSPAGLRHWIGLNPDPATPAAIAQVVSATKDFDRACRASRDLLANLGTAVTARDMDRLRAALGQGKLDYLGFSYGTFLGALYAEAFPGRVGRMVLDGAVDPGLGTVAFESQQGDAFELDLHDFFAWCPTSSTCSTELPGGAAPTYHEVMARLQAGGTLRADLEPALGGVQQVGYGVALTGVVSSLYTTASWPYLAEALAGAAEGDGSILAALAYEYAGFNANGTASNVISAYLAISCLDRPSPPESDLPAMARQFAKTAPDFGPAEAWGTLPCDYWPVPPTGRVEPIHLAEPLPILVVGSTHDPATPYAWAEALTKQLDGAELLTRTGDGHTGYFSSSCVQGLVDAYLSTGKRPPDGTVCASGA